MEDFGASFAVSSAASGLMSKIATLQPSSASRSVMPRPMPWPPPVTTATFPDRPFTFISLVELVFGRRQRYCRSAAFRYRMSVLREHLPRDDRFHDLDRSAGDLDHPGVGIGAGDRIFPHIAPAAEQLQALVDRFAMQFRGEHFCHG